MRAIYPAGHRFDIKLVHVREKDCFCWEPTPDLDSSDVLLVTNRSVFPLRRAVERCGIYFQREFSYDFIPYDADKHDPTLSAYIWFAPLRMDRYHLKHGSLHCVAGAACFGIVNWESLGPTQTLEWVWLHPFLRNQGLLTRAWPLFEARHPRFVVAPPFSRSMAGFLKKIGYENRLEA